MRGRIPFLLYFPHKWKSSYLDSAKFFLENLQMKMKASLLENVGHKYK